MYKILIVDDEFEIRNGLANFFPWNAIGFDVSGQAENGRQALELLKRQPVDVVLTDILMPQMNGLDLAAALARQYPKVRVVFLSAHRDFEFAQKALEMGVKSYIMKSTNYNELIRSFSKLKVEMDESMPERRPVLESSLNFNEKIIAIIRRQVEENYRTVTLEDLTEKVHMNPDYISRFFKKNTGENFSDYLMRVRMEKAAALLEDIRYKVYEVSDMVGYANSFNFTRAFKSHFQVSPREYRSRKPTARSGK